MKYTAKHIAKITKGKIIQTTNNDQTIHHLLTDSRQIISPQTGIFIALKGEQYDGHTYLKAAYEAGVRCFLISDKKAVTPLKNATIILVKNTLFALQKIATQQRLNFNYPVIGITGSNGKTIVKEWLFQLLRKDFHIVRSPKSYNSQIGVPLSVAEMKKGHDLAIFEAGISQPNEMEKLENIIRPTLGILTNIGAAHDEGFSSKKEKVEEKIKLFENANIVICEEKYAHYFEETTTQKILTWGRKKSADLRIYRITKSKQSSRIFALWQGEKSISVYLFKMPLPWKMYYLAG